MSMYLYFIQLESRQHQISKTSAEMDALVDVNRRLSSDITDEKARSSLLAQ